MAVVGLYPAIAQAGLVGDAPRHADGRVDVRDAGARLTHVDIDQDADRPISAGQRRQRVHAGLAVGHDSEVGHVLTCRHQPPDHRRRHDGRGDEDAVEPRSGHDLGLAHGRAAQADGAGCELTAGDLRRLVRLDVRPQLAARVGHGVRHRLEVRLERVQVEEQRGGRQLLREIGCPDQGFVRA